MTTITKAERRRTEKMASVLGSIPKKYFIENEKHENKLDSTQKKFLQIWKKYISNKMKHQKEFLEICNKFGILLQEGEKIDNEHAKVWDHYSQEYDKLIAKMKRQKKK